MTIEARFEACDRQGTEVSISGLPDPVIRESRGRLLCALKENGLGLAQGKLFLNLVPAARRKSGGTLDLPLALGAAAACGHLEGRWFRRTLFIGELGIDGRLHAVPGGLAAAGVARAEGLRQLIAPGATAREAAWIPEVAALPARHLSQVVAHLSGAGPALELLPPPSIDTLARERERGPSLDEVRGHGSAKRALAVAALGGHGLLMTGPPGAGKSMLARRMIGLLPPLALEERIEITRVLSAAGMWPGGLVCERPFRAPHHTASYAGLVGGGSPPAPGEISLAHRGLLFLDELPEFRRESLEALRQPLETGVVGISRAGARIELPARFQLVAAMNPCPCGFRGDARRVCRCSPNTVDRYRRRISGPLLDRIELRLELQPPRIEELLPTDSAPPPAPGTSHAELVVAVRRGIEFSRARQGGRRNVDLDTDELDEYATLDSASRTLLAGTAEKRNLSARALQALRRVARTLADLEASERLHRRHLAEALGLRAEWP